MYLQLLLFRALEQTYIYTIAHYRLLLCAGWDQSVLLSTEASSFSLVSYTCLYSLIRVLHAHGVRARTCFYVVYVCVCICVCMYFYYVCGQMVADADTNSLTLAVLLLLRYCFQFGFYSDRTEINEIEVCSV